MPFNVPRLNSGLNVWIVLLARAFLYTFVILYLVAGGPHFHGAWTGPVYCNCIP